MAYQFVLPESVSGFHDYFKLNVPIEDICKALGFVFDKEILALPHSDEAVLWESDLHNRLDDTVRLASFTSEMARREYLIAPILVEVARQVNAKLRSEYPVNVSEQLRGSLDYFLLTETRFFVVEAKNADMERGFAQLAAEMAALDKWTETSAPYLYGAVSIGDLWRFGVLDRNRRTLTQDIKQFIIPQNLSELVAVLIGILRGESAPQTP